MNNIRVLFVVNNIAQQKVGNNNRHFTNQVNIGRKRVAEVQYDVQNEHHPYNNQATKAK